MSRHEFHYLRNLVDWDEWAFFSFRCAYRCPSNVSKRYSKLRQYFSNFKHGNIFRASTDNTVHVFDDREFKVVPYSKTIDLYNIIQDLPGKELEKESLLLVIDDQAFTWIDCSPIIEKLRSKFYSSFVYTNRHEDGFKRCPFKELPFTGVQYHTVIIIMIPKEGGTYYDYSEVLYHAVSRTLRRALIICQFREYNELHPRLSLTTVDIHILLKLKKGGKLSQEEFQAIIKNNRIECAVEVLAVSNNAMQWEFLKTNWEKYLEDDSIEYYEKEKKIVEVR